MCACALLAGPGGMRGVWGALAGRRPHRGSCDPPVFAPARDRFRGFRAGALSCGRMAPGGSCAPVLPHSGGARGAPVRPCRPVSLEGSRRAALWLAHPGEPLFAPKRAWLSWPTSCVTPARARTCTSHRIAVAERETPHGCVSMQERTHTGESMGCAPRNSGAWWTWSSNLQELAAQGAHPGQPPAPAARSRRPRARPALELVRVWRLKPDDSADRCIDRRFLCTRRLVDRSAHIRHKTGLLYPAGSETGLCCRGLDQLA